jgi:hypothetical protein
MFACSPTPRSQQTSGIQFRESFEKIEIKKVNCKKVSFEWVRRSFEQSLNSLTSIGGDRKAIKLVQADIKPPIHISKASDHSEHEAPPQPLSKLVHTLLNKSPPLNSTEARGAGKIDTSVTPDVDIDMAGSQPPAPNSCIRTTAGAHDVHMATDPGEAEATNTLPSAS